MTAAFKHPVGPPQPSIPRRSIPPLQNGDRLDRREFFRRFDATPNLKKAELLEGIVYMSLAPVSTEFHAEPHALLAAWLANYMRVMPGVAAALSGTVILDDDNSPQPDLFLRIRPTHGGRTKTDDKGYLIGAPELIAECAASSASYDLHVKKDVYRKHGVKEYVAWRVYDTEIDWFVLRGEQYQPLKPDAEGIVRSETFPGLWLDVRAMLAGDLAAVAQQVQRGVATQAHQDFVAQLQAAAKARA